MLIHRLHQRATAHRTWSRRWTWCGGWLLAAGWAAAFSSIASPAPHRVWGSYAAAGYLLAAVAASLPRQAGPGRLPVLLALAGAVVVPLCHLVLTGGAQSEVLVMERSGSLTVQHGTPYLPHPRTVGQVTPYLPGMAVFGLPRALLGAGSAPARWIGDARLWCAAVFIASSWSGYRVLVRSAGPASPRAAVRRDARRDSGRLARDLRYGHAFLVLVASPIVALPLCVSAVDLPLTGLLCLGLALAVCRRPVAAGLALAAACSLKWTAWPAVLVASLLLARVSGRRGALRCAGVSLAGTVAVVLPSAVLAPGPLVRQVLAFPVGRGALRTPADSPMPGTLLARLGPAGWCAAVLLLLIGGLAIAVSLYVWPPADLVPAADRLATGLALAFLLAPAGRFGYLTLPVVLGVWPRLVRGASRPAPPRGGGITRITVPHRPVAAGRGR